MIFKTALADALYVNWALPVECLPKPPAPLELDRVLERGESFGFATLVLFHQEGLRAAALPWPRFSFPQCNLRLPVRDGDGQPAVWILRELVPAWVVPWARAFGRQPASAAVFDVKTSPDGAERRWALYAGQPLAVRARPAAPAAERPSLGAWVDTVAFFRDRPRAYLAAPQLRRIETAHPRLDGLPVSIEVQRPEWLAAQLPAVAEETWSRPHSAFVVASARLSFAVESGRVVAVPAQAPVPG